MQTFISILAIASIVSITSAAPSPAAAATAKPTGYIKVYQDAACVELEGVEAKQYDLPEGKCTNISPSFLSFQGKVHPGTREAQRTLTHVLGGTQDPKCPKGTKATVFAFEGVDCTEQSLGAPELAASEAPSSCINSVFAPSVGSGEGLDVNGKSAKFSCVT